ncbi:hypothetical protein MRQ47_004430 [Salmonella enterica]|nr:hypothetical protein [Salmonella enterica]
MNEQTRVTAIAGVKALVNYDPEIGMFRGSFTGLNGGADFYAPTLEQLHTEGVISLRVYLEAAEEHGLPILGEDEDAELLRIIEERKDDERIPVDLNEL